MGKCRSWSVQNLLDLYADGRLGPDDAGRVAEHLKACKECRKAEAGPRELRSLLAASPAAPAPAGLADAILEALEQSKDPAAPKPAPAEGRWVPGAWRPTPAHALAAGLAALLAAAELGPVAAGFAVPPQAYTPAPAWEWEAPR